MTLSRRLILGLAAVVLLLGVPLVLAIKSLGHAERAANELSRQEVAASLLLGRSRVAVQTMRTEETSLSLFRDSTGASSRLATAVADVRPLADSLTALGLTPASAALRRAAEVVATYAPQEQGALFRKNGEAADSISGHFSQPALHAADDALDRANDDVGRRAQLRTDDAADAARNARRQALALGLAAIAGALAVTLWLTRSVAGPVRALERGLDAVAAGDFTHELGVAASRRDEFGRLAASFEQMAAQLAELDKLKATFMSVASHELKTPINVILGYVTLLTDELYGPVPEAQRAVLSTIERQTRTLTRLVQHLLDVSRFEAGVARLQPRPVALRAILIEAEQSHALLARQRGIEFATNFSPELPDVVTWDSDRVGEVLDNLLSNAVKFTPEGGRVELAASPDRRRGVPSVVLSVRDSGVGIAADQLPRVFEKFYQADNQHGAADKGSGLGLAISKEIVDAHGGAITVDSTPGEGTRFSVTLPTTATDGAVVELLGDAEEPPHDSEAERTALSQIA